MGPCTVSSQMSTSIPAGVSAATVASPSGMTPTWKGDHLAAGERRVETWAPGVSVLKAGFTRRMDCTCGFAPLRTPGRRAGDAQFYARSDINLPRSGRPCRAGHADGPRIALRKHDHRRPALADLDVPPDPAVEGERVAAGG